MSQANEFQSFMSNLFNFESEKEEIEHGASMNSLSIMELLLEYMERKSLSKKDLSEKLDTSKSYITQLCTGDKLVNMKLLYRLEKALGVKYDFSLRENNVPSHDIHAEFMYQDMKNVSREINPSQSIWSMLETT